MSGSFDYVGWIIIPSLQMGVVVCAIWARSFLRFFPLNFYMLAATFFTAARYFVMTQYGVRSDQYRYFYYYSDVLMTICLFFALMCLFSYVFDEMGAKLYIRVGAILVLGLISAVSYGIVRQSQDNLVVPQFAQELSQNLYFVGAVLSYVLWAAIRKLRESRTQVIQLVLALGVYFSAFAAGYALSVIYPNSLIYRLVSYGMAVWLPMAWGYTFLKIPEGARLATARVAMGSR